MLLELAAVFACVCILAALSFYKNIPPSKFPPGPTRYPFVANLFNGPVPGLFPQFVASLRSKYGPIIGFKNFGQTFVITQEPEITNELFLKNGSKVNQKPPSIYMDVQGGKLFTKDGSTTGLASVNGDIWRDNRRFVMSTVFGADKIRKLDYKMLPELALFVNWLDSEVLGSSPSAIIDPVPYFQKMTLNVIGSIIADVRCHALDGTKQSPEMIKFAENIVYMMDTLGGEFNANKIVTMLLPPSRSFEKFEFPKFVRTFIERSKREFSMQLTLEREKDIQANGLPESPSIIDMLVEARLRDPEFHAVELDHIVGIMSDLFAGGTDTTAITLSWASGELVNHPEIQTRLIDEIDTVIGRDRQPTLDDLPNLPFLDAVIHETLRRRPIVWSSAPVAVEEEITLQNGKYVIPVGTWCMMNIWGMLNDPAYWPEPDSFNPQRWIDDPELKRSPAFQPFRAGLRNCIGRFLAVTEMKLALACLVQRFSLSHPDGEGHKLTFTERDGVGLHKPDASTRIRLSRRQ